MNIGELGDMMSGLTVPELVDLALAESRDGIFWLISGFIAGKIRPDPRSEMIRRLGHEFDRPSVEDILRDLRTFSVN